MIEFQENTLTGGRTEGQKDAQTLLHRTLPTNNGGPTSHFPFTICFQQLQGLARLYLMTLYVIFPIHVNFPITSRFVLKATIQEKKQSIVLCYLGNFFSKRPFYDIVHMLYLINFSILPQSVPIFHVSLSIIYQLFFTISSSLHAVLSQYSQGIFPLAVFL